MTKRSTRKVFNEFCESTSLHGYTYWYNADSVILKVAWAVVILAATCLGMVFLANQTKEYIDGRILTTIETSSAPLDVSMENHCNSYYTKIPKRKRCKLARFKKSFHQSSTIYPLTNMFPILENYMAICNNL